MSRPLIRKQCKNVQLNPASISVLFCRGLSVSFTTPQESLGGDIHRTNILSILSKLRDFRLLQIKIPNI